MSNVIIFAGCFVAALFLVSIAITSFIISSDAERAAYHYYVSILKSKGIPDDKIPSYTDFTMRDTDWDIK